MKKILFIAAACMFAAACTPQNGGGETASLEVSPKSLTFGAEDTTPQEITVTATGVEWEYAVPSSADWITVDDGTAGKLLVSVAKNPTAEKRTASIRITAKDNDDLEPVSVTVTQAGSETPEVYSLTVDPAALTFEAEGAAGQSVKVTASGEGITWSAAVEDAAKEWITLSATEGAEGETTLTVTVQDNPDTAERSANVTLTPSVESVGPKAIRVTQEAKVLPPSLTMTYKGGTLPEEGFVSDYIGRGHFSVDVCPVNVSWNVRTEYVSGGTGWLHRLRRASPLSAGKAPGAALLRSRAGHLLSVCRNPYLSSFRILFIRAAPRDAPGGRMSSFICRPRGRPSCAAACLYGAFCPVSLSVSSSPGGIASGWSPRLFPASPQFRHIRTPLPPAD